MTYDINLFVEIIDTIPDIQFLRDGDNGGMPVRYYQSKHGKLVLIDMSEEDIPYDLGRIYLDQLGIYDLAEALFPESEE